MQLFACIHNHTKAYIGRQVRRSQSIRLASEYVSYRLIQVARINEISRMHADNVVPSPSQKGAQILSQRSLARPPSAREQDNLVPHEQASDLACLVMGWHAYAYWARSHDANTGIAISRRSRSITP